MTSPTLTGEKGIKKKEKEAQPKTKQKRNLLTKNLELYPVRGEGRGRKKGDMEWQRMFGKARVDFGMVSLSP